MMIMMTIRSSITSMPLMTEMLTIHAGSQLNFATVLLAHVPREITLIDSEARAITNTSMMYIVVVSAITQ